MAISKRCIAPLRDLVLVFAVCAFPIYSWSIYYFLERMPAWLYYLDLWEVVSIFAYTQAFAFLESMTIVLTLMLAAALLPFLFRDRFVAIASVLVLLTTVAAAVVQFNDNALRASSLITLGLGGGLLLIMVGLLFLIYRQRRVQAVVESIAERLSVLLYLYLPLSLMGIIIVIIRNIG